METTELPPQEGIKETLDSIVVALILAFVFRAFIVEAFVIPTGSMAPTLYGAHGTILCEDCGFEFAYGLHDLDDSRPSIPILSSSKAICPNCHHANTRLKTNDEKRNPEKGDRILVLKWPFNLGGSLLGPARWDVIVFKDPADGDTNFIKRMAGLPNEVLMIQDGDVYTVPTDRLSAESRAELDRIRHEKYELRTGLAHGRLRSVPVRVLRELDQKMTIARKPPAAQQALWFVAYDNDYPSRIQGPYQPIWSALRGEASGWDTTGRQLRFKNHDVDSDVIELDGKEIRAACAYNIRSRPAPPVSDLRVSFVFTPNDAKAAVSIALSKRNETLIATVRTGGLLTLAQSDDRTTPSRKEMATVKHAPFLPGHSYEISFENVDYRLALVVGGQELLTSSDDPVSPAYYAPDLPSLRRARFTPPSRPRIEGLDGSFELRHVLIERDVYYYRDSTSRALALPWAPRSGWGSAQNPILLREGEYFMLGDNTAASKDSRLWDQVGGHLVDRGEAFQLGTVPRDQLIGQAFFVYWPSGHRMSWLPRLGSWNWPIIPDVGRMRWIR